MKPLVSIFTLSYNKPGYVSDAIRSVLSQTFKDFEYIIVENSTDLKTKKVVKSFKEKRIKYFDEKFTEKQRKSFYVPAFLLNKYYKKAKGEYIIFLSDDDILLPNCLKEMTEFLNKNQKINVCYHDQVILYAVGGKLHLEPLVRGSDKVFRKFFFNPKDALDGGQIMFRKKVLENIQEPYLPVSWDTADVCDKIFMEKLWFKYPFYPVKKILSIHRVVNLSTHRVRNPIKYKFYRTLTAYLPSDLQVFLSKNNQKRRKIKLGEQEIIEKIKLHYSD